MDLGHSLKIALAKKNIKQKDFAERLKVSAQQVSKWINTGKISSTNLGSICEELNMQVSEFVSLGE